MRFLILHYHIFKNAGTTVENLLQKSFPHSFARFEGDGRDAQLSATEVLAFVREHPELQAISSHHLRYPRPSAPGFVFFDLLFLRDPIDRLGSIYTFFQQGALSDDPLNRLAHESDLRGFFSELLDKHPHIANNPQVNMLAGDGAYTRPPGPADLARGVHQRLALLLGQQSGKLGNASLERSGHLEQRPPPSLYRRRRPGNERAFRRRDRGIELRLVGTRAGGQHLAGGGVDDIQCCGTGRQSTVDQQVEFGADTLHQFWICAHRRPLSDN